MEILNETPPIVVQKLRNSHSSTSQSFKKGIAATGKKDFPRVVSRHLTTPKSRRLNWLPHGYDVKVVQKLTAVANSFVYYCVEVGLMLQRGLSVQCHNVNRRLSGDLPEGFCQML